MELINELCATIAQTRGRNTVEAAVDQLGTIADLLSQLAEHATRHFALEEKCMLETAYSGYARHKQAHEEFKNAIEDLRRCFEEGEPITCEEMLESLMSWFEDHILGLDRRLGEFIARERRERQARAGAGRRQATKREPS